MTMNHSLVRTEHAHANDSLHQHIKAALQPLSGVLAIGAN